MAGNPNYDALLSTTLNDHRPSIEDNIFDDMPLLFWITKNGNTKRTVDGGVAIVVPLLYGKNTTVGSFSGYDIVDTAPQEGITAASFDWKQMSGSISISREEERKNSGEKQIINLLSTKIQQCEMSMKDKLSEWLFADGLGNDGKDYLGLNAICAIAPTTGTLGGIDRATNSWWRNYAVAGTQTSTAYDNLRARMRTAYNTCSKGKNHPDFFICDQSTFEGYEGLLTPQERFTDKKVGDAGFENLKFKNAVVNFDEDCINHNDTTKGRMYVLNSKHLSFVVDAQTDFITTDFVRPENQVAKVAQILHMGELTVNNCERLGVIYDIN